MIRSPHRALGLGRLSQHRYDVPVESPASPLGGREADHGNVGVFPARRPVRAWPRAGNRLTVFADLRPLRRMPRFSVRVRPTAAYGSRASSTTEPLRAGRPQPRAGSRVGDREEAEPVEQPAGDRGRGYLHSDPSRRRRCERHRERGYRRGSDPFAPRVSDQSSTRPRRRGGGTRVATSNLERPARGSWKRLPRQLARMDAIDADVGILTETRASVPPAESYQGRHTAPRPTRRPDLDERWVSASGHGGRCDRAPCPGTRGCGLGDRRLPRRVGWWCTARSCRG